MCVSSRKNYRIAQHFENYAFSSLCTSAYVEIYILKQSKSETKWLGQDHTRRFSVVQQEMNDKLTESCSWHLKKNHYVKKEEISSKVM